MDYINYIISTANPRIESIYYGIAIVLAMWMGTVLSRCHQRGKISKEREYAILLLIEYVFLVFSSTVFSRMKNGYYHYKLVPFWSYKKMFFVSGMQFWDNFFNVLLLMPMGILLPIAWKRTDNTKSVVWIGFLTSLTIELMQLIFKRGWFDVDDLFHNTIGVLLGYWIYCGVRTWKCSRRMKK